MKRTSGGPSMHPVPIPSGRRAPSLNTTSAPLFPTTAASLASQTPSRRSSVQTSSSSSAVIFIIDPNQRSQSQSQYQSQSHAQSHAQSHTHSSVSVSASQNSSVSSSASLHMSQAAFENAQSMHQSTTTPPSSHSQQQQQQQKQQQQNSSSFSSIQQYPVVAQPSRVIPHSYSEQTTAASATASSTSIPKHQQPSTTKQQKSKPHTESAYDKNQVLASSLPPQLYGNSDLRLRNDLLLRAARRMITERIPCWIMRQGLPSFRSLSNGKTFWEVCCTPDIASDCTVAPVKKYGVDAAILFTDILAPLQSFGIRLVNHPKYGMSLSSKLSSPAQCQSLTCKNLSASVMAVTDAIHLSKMKLRGEVPLIGIIGGPFTLACFLINGHASLGLHRVKSWIMRSPTAVHDILQKVSDMLFDFIGIQIERGVQALQISEILLGELPSYLRAEFGLRYLHQINLKMKQRWPFVPSIIYVKNGDTEFHEMVKLGFDVVSIDYTMDPIQACAISNGAVCLQGNLDPKVLSSDLETIKREVNTMLSGLGRQGTIGNLGGGLDPDVDMKAIVAFVEAVHSFTHAKYADPVTPILSPALNRAYSALDTSTAQLVNERLGKNWETETNTTSYRSHASSIASPRMSFSETFVAASIMRTTKKSEWVPDHCVHACTLCDREFGFFRRKHHCRRCGNIFCHSCSSKKAIINYLDAPARVCDRCYGSLTFIV